MQTWEEKILIKQEGIAEGRLEGRLEGKLEGKLEEKQELTRKLANKFSIEQIAEMLEIDISEVENILKESQNGKWLEQNIASEKTSKKTKVKYMQTWEEKILIKQEGIAEGRKLGYEEGEKELLKNLVRKKLAKNISTEHM